MLPQEFCYWLQGFFELADPTELTPQQVDLIERHLNMVDITVAAGKAAMPSHEPGARC